MRLSYQFRTAWLDGISNGGITAADGGDTYWDDDAELDLSIRYQYNDALEFFFDAVNLTDGPGLRYATGKPYVEERETFGERFIMGVRATF